MRNIIYIIGCVCLMAVGCGRLFGFLLKGKRSRQDARHYGCACD